MMAGESLKALMFHLLVLAYFLTFAFSTPAFFVVAFFPARLFFLAAGLAAFGSPLGCAGSN